MKIKNPQVSVVIPNWNGREFLQTCLDSLGKQSYKDFETIIVDNGSSDGSVQFVRDSYPDVRLVELSENKGFSVACNKGIRLSRGDYIALLNNDTQVDKNWLRELIKAMGENPEVGICGSLALNFYDREIIDSAGDGLSRRGVAFSVGYGAIYSDEFSYKRYVFSVSASSAMYRREVFAKVGLFDETFFAYFEDIDIGLRAQLMGFKCLYTPASKVYHIRKATSDRVSDLRRYLGYRNLPIALLKNLPLSVFIRSGIAWNLSFKVLSMTIRSLMRPWSSDAKIILSADWYLFRNFLSIMRKRRRIIARKTISDDYLESMIL